MAIVWQFSIINLEKKALVSGVVLRELPFMHSGRITSLKNLFKLSRSYFMKRFSNEEISILNDGLTIETTTDEYKTSSPPSGGPFTHSIFEVSSAFHL